VNIDLIVTFARVAATVFVSELRLRRDDQRAMRLEFVAHVGQAIIPSPSV
jgi:hypothetical protein